MKESKEATIYPLLPEHIERMFRGKDVFCKYTGRGNPRIKEGSKLLFYASGSRFEICGEATIRTIEFLTPEETVGKYEKRLFITREELDNYRNQRDRPPEKKLMVLGLFGVKRYDKPRRTLKAVTMAGQTLSKSEYKELLSR